MKMTPAQNREFALVYNIITSAKKHIHSLKTEIDFYKTSDPEYDTTSLAFLVHLLESDLRTYRQLGWEVDYDFEGDQ